MNPAPIAIIGVGNALMGDEGIGIHAINYLQQFDWPEDIELIDAGVPGPALLHMIQDREISIIIDCGDFGGEPGEIIAAPKEKFKKPDEEGVSLHGASLLGTLSLAEEADIQTGSVVIICVQPKSIGMSHDISDELSNALPKIRQELKRILKME